jgi:hypothetical protein
LPRFSSFFSLGSPPPDNDAAAPSTPAAPPPGTAATATTAADADAATNATPNEGKTFATSVSIGLLLAEDQRFGPQSVTAMLKPSFRTLNNLISAEINVL